jgi:hypothetical protein
MLEYRVLRRTCGPKKGEIIGGWRNLHNDELHNVYFWPNIMIKSRRMTWVGHIACMRAKVNAYVVLLEEPEGKRPLEKPRCRWEDAIIMDLKRNRSWGGGGGLNWIFVLSGSEQRPVEGSCEQSNEPFGLHKMLEIYEWLSDCWLLKKDLASWS